MNHSKWYKNSYRRNLVDMHIEDWDKIFLSNFDAHNYVELLKIAHIKSAMIYANSHVGHCYFPTKIGHMHSGLNGKDILGEVTEGAHKAGMDVIVYYSLIFNNWVYDRYPSTRMIDVNGKPNREGKNGFGTRYGLCCPNSKEYRGFLIGELEELCINYEFEGVFFDMTFWPMVCYCDSCKERFLAETGKEIPKVINWMDSTWLEFQKKREEWITEFAFFATNEVKKYKPEASVEHQCANLTHSWMEGVTEGVAKASEYVGGDLYGGFHQQSFVCKLYYSMTQNQPFEYMTSRCYNLLNHTTMKSKQMLELHTYLTLAHSGAFLIIDAIDLDGRLNKKVYEAIGEVFGKSKDYEPYLGGELQSDVAIFFSQKSKMDFTDNNKSVENKVGNIPHLKAALGAARVLRENHIPFGVISNSNLDQLSSYQVVILPELLFLSEEEAGKICDYVKNGGRIYMSGNTPLDNFNDILGVSRIGQTVEKLTYMAPTDKGSGLMPDIDPEYPLFINNLQVLAEVQPECEILATITLPYTNPEDTTKFASIHSNPPGKTTSYPALVAQNCGKGKIIWVAAPLEAEIQDPHKETFARIIKALATKPFVFKVKAHPASEILLFDQQEQKRFIINVVNIQEQFPLVPLSDIQISIKLNSKIVKHLSVLPHKEPLNFLVEDDYAIMLLPKLEVYTMIELTYK